MRALAVTSTVTATKVTATNARVDTALAKCGRMSGMGKINIQTALAVVTIVGFIVAATLWIGSSIAALQTTMEHNTKAISNNTKAIAELRVELKEDIAELRGLIFSHVSGHQHGVSDASGVVGGEQESPSN